MPSKTVRLFAAAPGVGVPPEGELFTPEDAARLVGSGLYTRTDPRARPKAPSKPARPAKEG